MLAAQHAPIGAKICTNRAIRTIGRKFFSRRRIAIPSVPDLNHLWSLKSSRGSRNYVAALGSKAGEKRCVLQLLKGAPLPWQMTAPASGSEAAMVAAQHAPIGAKICTARAIRTIGRKFFSRRIANPSASDLNHQQSPKSRSGSRNYVAASRTKLVENRCILRRGQGAIPRYQASGVLQLNPQPSVVNSQSFRRLLEF